MPDHGIVVVGASAGGVEALADLAASLHGEWLRRAHRPTDARLHLHVTLEVFERLGALPGPSEPAPS
jgi:NADH dehydrogenase FAD-containing subunit